VNPPPGIRPVFLFTGAEEWGLLGALMAAKNMGLHASSETFLINIDSVAGAVC
jgi:Zn-dependent M28 family amino/carboxypeptidase